jgi:hypothetical protein
MKASKIAYFWLFLLFLLPLAGCTGDIGDELEKAKMNVQQAFEKEAETPNQELDFISLYVPFGMTIERTDENNFLLEKGKQMYILFINPNETADSKAVYESTRKGGDEWLLDETFTSDGKFGYVLVASVDEDLYEVTVGIGGIKMTTETSKRHVADYAGSMMETVSSVEIKKNKE